MGEMKIPDLKNSQSFTVPKNKLKHESYVQLKPVNVKYEKYRKIWNSRILDGFSLHFLCISLHFLSEPYFHHFR